ncbi:hypothetical protein [Vibrio cholerae]|nr:hypothetical protein [Vibrio cholerae]EGQ99356.1 hypothetical protein VCHE39_2250 [Vibrio cholerae HE39]EKL31158.1 hypothetical protein VCHE40_1318 [Vibrio cholerae HE-40]EKL35987.1 hypothetical protein VCHE46_1557 [Vibrio cholerae HE-46]KNH56956.1 hypothetical protein A55_1420 [Vibrio cholerae 1587]EHP3506157.1 hypothetical protein [Vibrio cholerae]
MNKHDIVWMLNLKYDIARDHEHEGLEVPSLLLDEIKELEQHFIRVIEGA